MNKEDITDTTNSAHVHVISKSQTSCSQCALNALCLPLSLNEIEISNLNKIINRNKVYRRNHQVYNPGDPFKSLFAVLSGSVKLFNIDDKGDEHVIDFFFPGDIFGLNAIELGYYDSIAKTMETTALCEFPFNQLENLARKTPSLQRRIYRLLSREILEDQQLQLLLSKKSAEERLGSFLLNLSQRYYRRKMQADSFRLVMSRRDIANHLGVAVETISRVFSKFQREKILIVNQKEVRIIDKHRLCGIAHEESRTA